MEEAPPIASLASAADQNVFSGIRWSGWLILVIVVICVGVFVVAQVFLTVFIFLRDNPDIIRYGYLSPDLQKKLTDPNYIITFLNAKNLWLLSVVSESVLALGTIFLARLMLDASTLSLGFRGRPHSELIFVGMAVGVLLFLGSSIVGALQTHFYGPHPQPQALALIKHHGLFDFTLDFMSVAVAAPLAEEIFFRGFLFAGLVQRMTPWLAVVLSALCFGIAHAEKWSFLPIFVIGIGLAWIYYRTRNLWVNIIAHATVNSVSLVLAYTVPQLVKT